jgi:hypothetical protein
MSFDEVVLKMFGSVSVRVIGLKLSGVILEWSASAANGLGFGYLAGSLE